MFAKKILTVTLGLLLVACSSAPKKLLSEQPLLVPQQYDLQLKDNTPGTEQAVGEINLQYVELENNKSRVAEEKINKAIRKMVGMDEAYSGNTDVSAKVKLSQLTDRYVLLVLESYSYRHGAANGQTIIESAYFDLTTGNRVELKQLLREGYQQALSQEVKQWLNDNEIKHEFTELAENNCFYQQNGQSYFCFSQYEIAAGAEGVINVPIKAELMSKWINKNGLLAQ